MEILEYFKDLNIPDKIKNNVITALATGIGRSLTEIATIPESLIKNWKILKKAENEQKIKVLNQGGDLAKEFMSLNPEIASRSLDNLGYKLIRTQKNKEAIATKMLNEIKLIGKQGYENKNCNQDWFYRYWNLVEEISDEDMQSILAKILADEIVHPETVGLNTITCLLGLSKKDILSFQKMCSLSIHYSSSVFVIAQKLPFQEYGSLEDYGISFGEILDFESLGLIRSTSLLPLGFESSNELDEVKYANRTIQIDVSIGFNVFYFTPAGVNISKNLSIKENTLYTEKLKEVYKDSIII